MTNQPREIPNFSGYNERTPTLLWYIASKHIFCRFFSSLHA
ncbi:MAG: hypothetical protein SAK29_03595 [Scytonema sp. PMC 1069.18]|nr:hypothetical protein [Scytonema sp. PMC 1069.18]